ncbi:TonB-dependent siderophore receptor [Variovorax ginsengisoli]|uniref:Iron complex outermembrane receptor protein n=1 Tax=Variovorax ginsengisoli TaxID=363844 RepID=A0ABT9S8L9_9BURK|nr:TonB-dependent receptor [Variovorax ginsengisoli]MDP9900701.1 iron complex outermembrane receptor protein [Variovorax ginsengisoli]
MRHPTPTFSLPSFRRPRTLVLACAAALPAFAVPGMAVAQPSQAAVERPLQLSIPAQPLALTVDALARQAGVGIGFDASLAVGKTAPAMQGTMTLRQALARALDGSGLEAPVGTGGASIRRRDAGSDGATLPTVTVTADGAPEGSAANAYRAASSSLGALGTKSLLDTPFSINVITRDLLDNQQAHSLVDAVKSDAAIAPGSNYTNGTGEVLSVRGVLLSYRNNYKLDGQDLIGFLGAPQMPVEHLESIEILRGAGGFLYGFGTPGGIVNMVSKRPTETPVRSIAIEGTGSGTALVHADLGGRFGENDRFGYRINAVDEEGDTYVKDGGHIKRRSGSVALDWRITPDLVWSVDALQQERRIDAVYYQLVPNADGRASNYAIAAAPAALDGSTRLASPFTYSDARSTTFGTSLAWHIAPRWDARLSYRQWKQDMQSNHSFLFANAAGAYSEQQISLPARVKSEQAQLLVTGGFDTGNVRHDLVLGISANDIRAQESNDYQSKVLGTATLASPGGFADPGLSTTWIDGGWAFPERQRSLFASDTLHLGDRWDLILGARHNRFTSNSYDKSAVTPTLAAVFRPVPWLSTYGSYVEALEQGSTAPRTATNANEVFPPIKSKQLEFGLKTEQADWSASAAVFRTTQGLTYTTETGRYSQDGEARYQGMELAGKAKLGRPWTLLTSAVFLDAENTKTSLGQYDGLRTPGASKRQFAAYVEYALPTMPLTLTGGWRYVSARPLDMANNWSLPGYATFDLGARYVTRMAGLRTTFRLNLDNVGDKAYWLMAGSNRLVQGAPRTVKLGAQFEF